MSTLDERALAADPTTVADSMSGTHAPRPAAALSVDAALVRFGPTTALDGVSIEVGANEVLALVGPSGCGKSTLLRSIAGLVGLTSGSISLAGTQVDDARRRLPPESRRVGLVFQEHSLFPHLTVIDNVTFGIRDERRRAARRRALDALEVVELAELAERYPHELSGGERQRVALARALAPRPTLLLLDEPFASLDPTLRSQLRRHLTSILRSARTPAVFVTHDQTEALSVGDRVAVMRQGRIEQLDDPATVFHRPVNHFVASFMGEASFLPLVVAGEGGQTELGPVEGPVGSATEVMVRPDDLIFQADEDGPALVVDTEFRGASWSCTVTLDSGSTLMLERAHIEPLEVGTRGRVSLAPGHRLRPVGG